VLPIAAQTLLTPKTPLKNKLKNAAKNLICSLFEKSSYYSPSKSKFLDVKLAS
jgi:hypothetical protein